MWFYSEKVKELFKNPRNVGEIQDPDAIGEVGNIVCGDALRLTLKIDKKTEIESNGDIDLFKKAMRLIQEARPFEGEIFLRYLDKCDPVGCKACLEVCPSRAWFIPKSGAKKIDVNENLCQYCGACEHACPQNCILVQRNSYKITKSLDRPWTTRWIQMFEEAIGKIIKRPLLKTIIKKIKKPKEQKRPSRIIPEIDSKTQKKLENKLDHIKKVLGEKKGRYWIEGRGKKRPKFSESSN